MYVNGIIILTLPLNCTVEVELATAKMIFHLQASCLPNITTILYFGTNVLLYLTHYFYFFHTFNFTAHKLMQSKVRVEPTNHILSGEIKFNH